MFVEIDPTSIVLCTAKYHDACSSTTVHAQVQLQFLKSCCNCPEDSKAWLPDRRLIVVQSSPASHSAPCPGPCHVADSYYRCMVLWISSFLVQNLYGFSVEPHKLSFECQIVDFC